MLSGKRISNFKCGTCSIVTILLLLLFAFHYVHQYTAHTSNNVIQKSVSIENWPIIIATWQFPGAVDTGYSTVIETKDSLRAVVDGCSYCEFNPFDCNWSVGYGSKPDQANEVTLDAMVMYGPTHDIGATGGLKNIKNAIGVALDILKYTGHTMLVGKDATNYAMMMGFTNESLSSNRSNNQYDSWRNNNCQPNSWRNVENQSTSCPPYNIIPMDDGNSNNNNKHDYSETKESIMSIDGEENHDTIGMLAIDENGYMSAGMSTNGLIYKVSGRVGDTPIPGSGAYVEQGVGGAVATGNGDVMMRFNPTLTAVLYMRFGMDAKEACDEALKEILKYYDSFSGAIICMDYLGNHAAANYGSSAYSPFHYTYRDSNTNESVIVESDPIEL